MLLGRKILLGSEEKPLIVLEKHSADLSKFNLDSAKSELNEYISQDSGESFTWGYFPGMEESEKEKYPECIGLGEKLKEFLFDENTSWELSFVRCASRKPVSTFGGFHIDVDLGVRHKRTDRREIIRALVNLHNFPRNLLYSLADRKQLRACGLKIPTGRYKTILLPENFVKKAEIPAIGREEIYILKFFSSLIPHFGLTDENGHFVAGFGRYAGKNDSV